MNLESLTASSTTKKSLQDYLSKPGASLLLTGADGSGKTTIAYALAAELLGLKTDKLVGSSSFLAIAPLNKSKEISIDSIRELKRTLSLKAPSNRPKRVVVISSAHTMSHEAQNSALKILEEPPNDTYFILSASAANNLLPTIVSRCWQIVVRPLALAEALSVMKEEFNSADIEKAWLISGGRVGLLTAILKNDKEHPQIQAIERAKKILKIPTSQKLIELDGIASDGELSAIVEAIEKIMAAIYKKAFQKSNNEADKILQNRRLILTTKKILATNANRRLVAIHLALNLRT
ncbi:hypothetical protein A3A68_00510 [Candidatus Saccharibacteria bacterium RIFCSPLOWO2_01_FULL_48_13]|nr:MAG: hypothetical protein A2884_00480 [Candidatus Saccharibacteria bacterium RIFCSPHIGHO2_01_FULL_48_12]OGL35312.1 MAG: hypothetical protein A3F38_01660 [Candidatus Saccharibacteria bacterium RIFCSPHIGHO2_12_FULL_48_21]OGL37547.1 MAG: hypothetical protein A3A68_00510 [Candidatus Saccharibacteria bacterium RIFCSPLOWO2_01_FULL_48_13]